MCVINPTELGALTEHQRHNRGTDEVVERGDGHHPKGHSPRHATAGGGPGYKHHAAGRQLCTEHHNGEQPKPEQARKNQSPGPRRDALCNLPSHRCKGRPERQVHARQDRSNRKTPVVLRQQFLFLVASRIQRFV